MNKKQKKAQAQRCLEHKQQKRKRREREQKQARKHQEHNDNCVNGIDRQVLETIHKHSIQMTHMTAGYPCVACEKPSTTLGVFIPDNPVEFGGVAGGVV